MSRSVRYILAKSLAITAVLFVVLIVWAPWKPLLDKKLTAALEAIGFRNVHLTISHIGVRRVVLKDLTMGDAAPVTLKNLTVDYSLSDLWAGTLHDMTATGLALEARQDGQKWLVSGVDAPPGDTKGSFAIPLTDEQLAAIPLSNATLKDSNLHIAAEQWHMDIPLHFTWQVEPSPKLSYKTSGAALRVQNIDVTSGDMSFDVSPRTANKQWKGPWKVNNIHITGAGPHIPILDGSGTLLITADEVITDGQIQSADQAYRFIFHSSYAFSGSKKSGLMLSEAILPWNGGIVSTQNVYVPIGATHAIPVNLTIQHASLDALLKQLTGEKAAATGLISGILPASVAPDGSISLKQGELKAQEPGTITMSPDAIPGDNAQITMLREILKNFHYSLLNITVDNDPGNKLSVLMKLEGNNPDMYEGRPVKLNVHLAGDVLNFIQQNIISLTDPKKFLEQSKHAKP